MGNDPVDYTDPTGAVLTRVVRAIFGRKIGQTVVQTELYGFFSHTGQLTFVGRHNLTFEDFANQLTFEDFANQLLSRQEQLATTFYPRPETLRALGLNRLQLSRHPFLLHSLPPSTVRLQFEAAIQYADLATAEEAELIGRYSDDFLFSGIVFVPEEDAMRDELAALTANRVAPPPPVPPASRASGFLKASFNRRQACAEAWRGRQL